MVGKGVSWGTLYLYELIGKCAYLYVGRGIDTRGIDSWTIGSRTKDVVPMILVLRKLCISSVWSG